MSEEILFADMLNHYSLKTNEVSNMLSNVVNYLNKCVAISRESWQSDAAEAFILQVSSQQQNIRSANEGIEELTKVFNALKNIELDAQISNLESEISASRNN